MHGACRGNRAGSGGLWMEVVRRLSTNLAKLPGLDGLTTFEDSLREHGVFA